MEKWTILGMQGAESLVDERDEPLPVVRVRMFIGEQVVDEDFLVPALPSGVPPSPGVYQSILSEKIDARVAALEKGQP